MGKWALGSIATCLLVRCVVSTTMCCRTGQHEAGQGRVAGQDLGRQFRVWIHVELRDLHDRLALCAMDEGVCYERGLHQGGQGRVAGQDLWDS